MSMEREGVRLAWRDFGGEGVTVVLLHGLAGHAEEWAETASWLTSRCHVIALDARGHGRSERVPRDVSPEAYEADAAFVIQRLGLSPVVLVGQSLGGLTALLVAARHPELVRALVLVEASPAVGNGEGDPGDAIAQALGEWPVPFASREAAFAFFAERFGSSAAAKAWTEGLEEHGGKWWPQFEIEAVAETLRKAATHEPYWNDWERVRCPTLIVRAGDGFIDPVIAQEMQQRLPGARLVELPDAEHDLHLDQPEQWRSILEGFVDSLHGPVAS